MNKTKQNPNSATNNSALQTPHWNSKLKTLADTLMHHIREKEEREKPGTKGVYIDFKRLK